jgi:hypothetical protein
MTMDRATLCLVAALLPAIGARALEETNAIKLLISKDGALLLEEGKAARRFETLADVARELAGAQGQFQVEAAAPPEPTRSEKIEARAGRKERPVRISSGEIAAIDLVRFLADYTGLTVIHDSADKSLADRMITVPSPIAKADDHLVKRLLEANHFRVTESATGPEGRVLLVESTDAPAGADEPRPRPIVIVDGEDGQGTPSGERSGVRVARGPVDGPVRSSGVVLEELPEVVRAQVDIPDGRGILVSDVDESLTRGATDLSVLRRFDVILNVNDAIISRPAKFTEALNALAPGEAFQIRVLRKGIVVILPARRKK